MSSRDYGPLRPPWLAVALLAGTLVVSAGCGSDSGSSSSPDDSASSSISAGKAVEEASKPVTEWTGPTASFRPPAGADITVLNCGSGGGGCQFASDGAAAAGKALGWNVRIVDGKFDPAVWNSAVRQAAAEGDDGIVLVATNPALLQEGLARARENAVPAVVIFQPPFPEGPKVDGYVTTDHPAGGKILGQFIATESEGTANVLVLDSPEYPEVVERNDSLVDTLEAECADCEVTREEFSAASLSQELSSQVTSLLQQKPDINYVYAPYSAADPFVAQGIRQAGKASTVKFASADATPDSFGRIRNGELIADLAGPATYMGWSSIDKLARILAGVKYETVTYVPQRLFTEANVADVPADEIWNTDVDYEAMFEELWGG